MSQCLAGLKTVNRFENPRNVPICRLYSVHLAYTPVNTGMEMILDWTVVVGHQ